MKNIRLLNQILKTTKAYRIIGIFLIFLAIVAFIMMQIEPEMPNYGEAMWYCYVNLFTIGFGDVVPETVAGKILSVFLTIYATVVIAVVTGVIVSLFNKISSARINENNQNLMDKLTRLPELSKEELMEISEQVKKFRKE